MKHLFILLLLSTGIFAQDNISQYSKYPPCEQKISIDIPKPTKIPALQKYPPCEEKISTQGQKAATENQTLQIERIEKKMENLVAMLKKIEEIIKQRTTESITKEN